ncbi:hypothetical protein PORY_000001 [Pneumocystis oryctolagi]|uniref:Uncharacterized protein n=1 Tax=Pneumocystis oryctolagi TaxID=42067 RepID=A0ACB7CEJ4_9ASCO|nr:hypothetical protein PORY_000001 [Pneumocystis oryctolagi]
MDNNTEFHDDDDICHINNHLINFKTKKLKNQLNVPSNKNYINQSKNQDNSLFPKNEVQSINSKNENDRKAKNFKLTNSIPTKTISPKKTKQYVNNKYKKILSSKQSYLLSDMNIESPFNIKHIQSSIEQKDHSNNNIFTKSPRTPDKNISNVLYFSKEESYQDNTWNFLNDIDSSPLRTPKSQQRIIDSLECDKLKSPSHIKTPKSEEISTNLSSPISINNDFKSSKTHRNLSISDNLIDVSDIQNTYAKQRSFVRESVNNMEYFFSSYNTDFKNCFNNESSPDDSEPHNLNIKNIHELRESGISKKSLDEVQYLVDGLNKCNTLRLRQSCYIELAKKMNKTEFSRNFRSGNFCHQLLENSKKDTDTIILYCTLFILCLIFQDKKCAYALVSDDTVFEIIFLGLSYNKDIIKLCDSKDYKIDTFIHDSFIDLIKTIKSSSIHLNYTEESSCYILSINAIKNITFLPIRKTSNHLEKMASFSYISTLYDIIDEICKESKVNKQIYTIKIIINAIEQCSFLMNSDIYMKRISTIITLLTSDLFNNSEERYKSHIFQSSLRLLINLTNNNSSICDEVAHSEFIQMLINFIISTKKEYLNSSQTLDNILLSLGLLINIIEKGSKFSHILEQYGILHIYIYICSPKTDTKNTLMGLVTIDKLINTFTEWRECSYSTENNVATGYLAILLTHLSLKNRDSKDNFLSKYIREKLPDNSYKIIIEFLQEFAQFNIEIEKEASGTFGMKSSGIGNEIQKISEILNDLELKLIMCK